MDKYETLKQYVDSLAEVSELRGKQADSLIEMFNGLKEAVKLMRDMHVDLVTSVEATKKQSFITSQVFQSWIAIQTDINSTLIREMRSALNTEQYKTFISVLQQKVDESMQSILKDENISEEVKSAFKKLSKDTFQLTVVK